MRILHTSDLHLGLISDGHSRRADQERVLDEILALCDAHAVDLLLIAGDLFSDRVEGGRHEEVARRLLQRLRDHLQRGRAVVLLRGNHDPLALFGLMRVMAAELAGADRWPLVVADMPNVYGVPGRDLQIVALPYIRPGWLRDQTMDALAGPQAQVTGLSGMLAWQLKHRIEPLVDPRRPAIFTAHVVVSGAQLNEQIEFETGYARELWLDKANLPHYTSYNALGHIHLLQEVAGTAAPTWYSGAPDRVDAGERAYRPRVLLVDAPDTPGGRADVREIAIQSSTSFVRRVGAEALDGVEQAERFLAEHEGRDPIGRVDIAGAPAAARAALLERFGRALPRVRVRFAIEDLPPPASADGRPDHHDVRTTVLDYLGRAFAERPEQRARLEAAFVALIEGHETGEAPHDH